MFFSDTDKETDFRGGRKLAQHHPPDGLGAVTGTLAYLAWEPRAHLLGHSGVDCIFRTCVADPGKWKDLLFKNNFFFFLQEASIFLYLTFTNLTQSILTCRLKVLSFSTSWVCWKISSLSLGSKYEIIIYFSLDLLAFLLLKIPWEQWGLLWE